MLGNEYNSIADALVDKLPSIIPDVITKQGKFVGRIVIGNGQGVASQITSELTNVIGQTPVTNHNSLSNLQGGTTNEYYHLTNAQVVKVDSLETTYSPTGHTHYQLHQPDGTNPFVYTDNGGNLHIDGNIYQSGSTYETHAEQIYTTKDYIYLRSGATLSLGDGEYTGFEAIRYDGTNNGRLVFDKNGWARVGDVGNEQPLATREEIPTNGYLAKWNSGTTSFETIDPLTLPVSNNTNILITGETYNRITGDTFLYDQITGETYERISGDTNILSKILWVSNSGLTISGITNINPRWNSSNDSNIYGTDTYNFNLLGSGFINNDGTYPVGSTSVINGGWYGWTKTNDGTTGTRLGIYAEYSPRYFSGSKPYHSKYSIRIFRLCTQSESLLKDGTILPNVYSDYEGNLYSGTKIGTQVWIRENLRTKYYLNGTPITYNPSAVVDQASYTNVNYSGVSGATNSEIDRYYGLLYSSHCFYNGESNFVKTTDGWYVPLQTDYETLFNYIISVNPTLSSKLGDTLKSIRQVNSSYTGLTSNISNLNYGDIISYGDLKIYNGEISGSGTGLINVPITGVTNLKLTLDNKSNTGHTHTQYLTGYTETNPGVYTSGQTDTLLLGKSDVGHTHHQLYQPDGSNPFVYTDNGGNLHVNGNIVQSGSTYETHAEQIYTTKDYIYLRSGATSSLNDDEYAGLEIINYDGANNGRLGFDKNGWARVGDVGNEQPLATREEIPTNGYLAEWNSGATRFETIDPLTLPVSTSVHNLVSGETANRIDGDTNLYNLITGLTENLNGKSDTGHTHTEYSPTGHTHYQLHQPDGTNPFVYTDNGGNLHIDGNIYQSGSTYETHAEQVYTTKDDIILRDGASAGLSTGELAGLTIKKYDGTNDGSLKIDKDGWMRVGDAGQEQKIATIEETTTDGYLMKYNTSTSRLEGVNPSTLTGHTHSYLSLSGGTLTGGLTGTTLNLSGSIKLNDGVISNNLNVSGSNFIGYQAGDSATSANFSNFLGNYAGKIATNANYSNFLGVYAGQAATNANRSNFIGFYAGRNAVNASYSNFLGVYAGYQATNASYSTLMGYRVGLSDSGIGIGSNNIIIGTNISLPDNTVNSMNLGGVLFGTGLYFDSGSKQNNGVTSGAKIGVNVLNPTEMFEVSGYTKSAGFKVSGTTGYLKSDGTVDSNSYSKQPISLTYSALYALKQADNLTVGQRYIINDYQTVHEIPNSGTWDANEQVMSANVINEGQIEPLLVEALTTNKIANECKSTLFPQDIIYYDIENNQSMVAGCTKGYIYRRVDTLKQNDIGFDYRNVKFRRYQMVVTNEHADGNTSYSKGSVVKKTGTNEVYIKLNGTNANFTDTSKWKRFEWDNLMYISPVGYNTTYREYAWNLIIGTFQIKIPTSANFKDYYLFSTAPTTGGVQSSYGNIYKNKFSGNNSNIISSSNTVFFGNLFYSNTIGDNFYFNTIRELFYSNSIGSYFNNNTIGELFYSNTIGNNFNSNTIGNFFNSNTIGNGFSYNAIGNNFNDNTIGNGFSYNAIGNFFSYNAIGSYFRYNTIGNNFNYNAIGNNFNSNGGIDFTSATYVYQGYNKELFKNSDNEQYLRYYDGNNVLQIVQANL